MAVGRWVFLSVLLCAASAAAIDGFPKLSDENDWPWWRGPQRNGYALEQKIPTKLDESSLIWKSPVPGRGHASPIVIGDRIFLATADEKAKVQAVLAFDRKTGKPVGKIAVNEGGFPERNHPNNTEATPTIACDGERLFAAFYNHESIQTIALDLKGKKLWSKSAGHFHPRKYEYGYGPSPLIHKDNVIIAGEYDGDSFIAAFKRKDGAEVWRIKRPNNTSFSSPVVAFVGGKEQLLISGADQVSAFDPADGKPLWSAPGTTAATCGTLVWDGDIVFASGGYPKAETLAVRADGSGAVLWKNNQKCYEQSMLVYKGYLYGLTDGGVAYCWRGEDGKEMWKQRLRGPVSASPVLAGGKIYWANELGTLYVFRADPEKFDLVAENQLGNDSFPSPAVCGNRIYLRTAVREGGERRETLYCFGDK